MNLGNFKVFIVALLRHFPVTKRGGKDAEEVADFQDVSIIGISLRLLH